MTDQRPQSFEAPPCSFDAPSAPDSPQPPVAPPVKETNDVCDIAIVALVLSIFSIFMPCAGFAFAIAAVVCGHIARGKIRNDKSLTGNGLALGGLITGYVVIAAYILIGIFFVLTMALIPVARSAAEAEERRAVEEVTSMPQPADPGAIE